MDDERGIRGMTGELLRDGVVVLPEYLPADRVEALRGAVDDLLDPGSVRSVDSRAAAEGDGPVLVGDSDGPGVATVVDAHLGSEVLEALRDEAVPEAVVNGCTEAFYRATRLEVRVATGPADPPGYRALDGEGFLAVAYLGAVRDAGDGPFAYIHGSHEESGLRRRIGSAIDGALDLGPGEATFYDASDGTAHPGPAGTLLVADGRGYHRFLPVREGRESLVAVIRFRPARREALDPDDDGWEKEWDEIAENQG